MELPRTPLFTGLRPSGDLTIANYLGAIKPMVDLQSAREGLMVFVADLHALTDNEPQPVADYRLQIAVDYMALGLDPRKSVMFVQSAIGRYLLDATMLLSRLITVAEIMRVPTLKDKLKDPDHPEQASVMLANYPILMAADILMQGAEVVPVGEDQMAHLEVARLLARRFNNRYGEIFVEPKPLEIKPVRILSLNGQGKMSKSNPAGAILLNEAPAKAVQKIKRAETAAEGQMNQTLESHFLMADKLSRDDEAGQLDELKRRHLEGEKVMGEFKTLLANQVERFLSEYQAQRRSISEEDVEKVLSKGNEIALDKAKQYHQAIHQAIKF